MLDVAISCVVPALLASVRVLFPLDAAGLLPCTLPAICTSFKGSSRRELACHEQSADTA